MTETPATNESPDVDELLAASERELEQADVPLQADAPALTHPLGETPACYRIELVDGRRMSVPVEPAHRERFFAERQAKAEAAAAEKAEREKIVNDYLAQTPLERARKYSDREAAAIEQMLPKAGGAPV